jgi:hypothetical protein
MIEIKNVGLGPGVLYIPFKHYVAMLSLMPPTWESHRQIKVRWLGRRGASSIPGCARGGRFCT